jgi:polysaccharide export outer membrane protein
MRRGPACAAFALAMLSVLLTSVVSAEYRIGVRDVISIAVWDHPELTAEYTVGADGTLTFPLLGPVKAAGLTAEELQAEIRKQLLDGLIREPQVTVNVSKYLSQRVFVVGEVRTPGPVALTGDLTLLEALTRAGSVTENAGGELLVVRASPGISVQGATLPGSAGSSVVLRASLQRLLHGEFATNASLSDGDTLVVPHAEFISVLGQVKNPGSVTLEFEMTVLRAISLAGGANDLGAIGRAKIVRIVNNRKTEIKAQLTDKLQAGDVVVVPMRLF